MFSSNSSQEQQQSSQQIKTSTSNQHFNINNNNSYTNQNLDSSSIRLNKNRRELEYNKSIDSLEHYQHQLLQTDEKLISNNVETKKSIKRNTSLINFKSLDFNLKSIYSSMKNNNKQNSSGNKDSNSNSKNKYKNNIIGAPPISGQSGNARKAPYVRVETVDRDETENLLTFPQSPYQHRGSFDRASTTTTTTTICQQSQYLTAQENYIRSQTNSPYLSVNTTGYIRRSSTSDIIDKNKLSVIPVSGGGISGDNNSRRPSTSDLLRKARERKGSESKIIGGGSVTGGFCGSRIGRSVSQGGLPRGGARTGRRTSMAF